MSILSKFLVMLLLSLFLGSIFNGNSLQCEDTRCKTGSCNSTGSCICDLPDLSTILEGDRPFFGGKFCDEEQIMCDGTNSFWCEHGGTCEEIVQGEIYGCKCLPGYAGEHCEDSGVPCGRIFCFHEAKCLVEGEVCECSPGWKGKLDCSLPTQSLTGSATNSTSTSSRQDQSSNGSNWLVVVLAFSCAVGAVVGAVIYTHKFFSKKETAKPKFQQLSEMQNYGILDDDEEDDSVIPDAIRDDKSHL